MKNLSNFFIAFFSKIAIALLAFSVLRFLFYKYNQTIFETVEIKTFLGGIRYDLFAVSYLLAPFILVYTFSFGQLKKTAKLLYLCPMVIAFAFEFIDFEYFKFTNKRTTFDFFQTEGMATDIWNLIPAFISDFWNVILLFILFIVGFGYLYDRCPNVKIDSVKLWERIIVVPLILILTVIASRGGIQLRPINFTDAGKYAKTNNLPLVLNTSYSLLKSSYKEDLKEVKWLSDSEEKKLFSPHLHFTNNDSSRQLNVVIIILESFGQEYIGTYNPKSNFTPFLDSLIGESMHFPNAYANGKKSIEALPAILSSLPNMMKSSYISSKYGGNRIQSIAKSLDKYGYNSSFYHGATTGTMGFNGFASTAGIESYYGLEDYPDSKDFDGKWGIFDEPYFNYFRAELNQKEEPFLSIIFSLSSHHPYTIPEQHKDRFPKGELPILESVAYTDYALSQFFEKSKKEEWFNNTLFVITADHTSTSIDSKFQSRTGIYKIPLIFYSPGFIKAKEDKKTVSQLDIYPTILDLIGLNDKIYAFGSSVLDTNKGIAINYLNSQYQLIQNDKAVIFDGEKSIFYQNDSTDIFKELNNNSLDFECKALEAKLKALIQRYNHDLIHNKTYHE